MTEPPGLRQTTLYPAHVALGARIIDFGGWAMPLQYRGILEEHAQVRRSAGLFDLSHMGELWVDGAGAGDGLAYALVSEPRSLAEGRAQYSMMCQPDGGIIDDLIVYRVAHDRFLIVPNASNASAVSAALAERLAGFDAALDDASGRTALIAVQGPASLGILAPIADVDLHGLRYYAIAQCDVAGARAWVARTGYTGEDGFEVFLANEDAQHVWDALMARALDGDLMPCGLGARDTLRLEAGMPLYGNELDRGCTPEEAALGRVVKLDKPGGFVGQDALERAAAAGPRKLLVGLILREPGIARHGYPVFLPGSSEADGVITSGSQSPTLGFAIAMARVPPAAASPGTMVQVGIRASRVAAEVVAMPFYRRQG